MFDNIGQKIKKDVKASFGLSVFLFVIGGIGVGIALGSVTNGGVGFVGGIIFIAISVLLSWHASFKTYAYGQIVENTDIMVKQLEEIKNNLGQSNVQPIKSYDNKNVAFERPPVNASYDKPVSNVVVNPVRNSGTEKEGLKYCPNCGEIQTAGKKFCEICGFKL